MLLVKKVSIPIYIGDIPTSSIHKITIPNTLTVFMQISLSGQYIMNTTPGLDPNRLNEPGHVSTYGITVLHTQAKNFTG